MALIDHLEKLKNLAAVAKYRSINEASKRIGLSQPSLSMSLKILENTLDCQLLIRSGQGVVPTEAGQILIEFANRLALMTAEVEGQLGGEKEELDVHLRIGTHESISIYFFPEFMRYLQSAFPKLRLSLKTGRSRANLDWLKSGDIDLAVSVEPQPNKKISSTTLFHDYFNFYIPPNLENWKRLPLILMPDALEMTGKPLKNHISYLTKGRERLLECENHETVRALCEEGLGIGLIPDHVARAAVARNRLIKVRGQNFPADIIRHSIELSYLGHRRNEVALAGLMKEVIRFSQSWSGAI